MLPRYAYLDRTPQQLPLENPNRILRMYARIPATEPAVYPKVSVSLDQLRFLDF
jgi:hypothetical protein